jgi:hypothetical protein
MVFTLIWAVALALLSAIALILHVVFARNERERQASRHALEAAMKALEIPSIIITTVEPASSEEWRLGRHRAWRMGEYGAPHYSGPGMRDNRDGSPTRRTGRPITR